MPALQTTSARVAAVPGRTRSAGLAAKMGPNFRPSMVKTAKGLFQTRLNAESYGVFELNYKADKVRASGCGEGSGCWTRREPPVVSSEGEGMDPGGCGCGGWETCAARPSVRPSVRPSLRPFVHPSITTHPQFATLNNSRRRRPYVL